MPPDAKKLPWVDPLEFATQFRDEPSMALLYSGMRGKYSGRYSYLAIHAEEVIEAEHWQALEKTKSGMWFGYLGYGLKNDLEKLPHDNPSIISLPKLRFTRFGTVFKFDHDEKKIETLTARHSNASWNPAVTLENPIIPSVAALQSNMTKSYYLDAVAKTRQKILDGDFYQANITRKFYGEFEKAPDSLSLFHKLCNASPAPYSAFMKWDDTAIISSSPECFLSVSEGGNIITRPIKGSAPRTAQSDHDRNLLATSSKDQAENLMIVDLMRNDLSRVCEAGSVKTEAIFELESYATIHHLVSTITGQKRADASVADVLKCCFPAGSMTGAPKISAMKWCSEIEKIDRGVYSGAIGWMNGGACDFSVAIRTLITQGNRFEFQVGGGIVADSTPEKEWQETLVKARGIGKALGIDEAQLAAL